VVLYENIRQDSGSGFVGERLGVGNAEFRSYAIVGEKEGQRVAGKCVLETTDVLITRCGRGRSSRRAGYEGGARRCGSCGGIGRRACRGCRCG
jgi:hypothetical protein